MRNCRYDFIEPPSPNTIDWCAVGNRKPRTSNSSSSAWRLGTWDAFQIPSPFARAALVFGATTSIDRDADRERARKDIQRNLDDATAAADRLVGA